MILATGWQAIDRCLAAAGVRFGVPTLAQTTGGNHVPSSWHWKGCARDYGKSNSDLPAVLAVLLPFAQGDRAPLVELFGLESFWKNGSPIRPNADLFHSHQNHVHAAIRPGATLPAPRTRLESTPMPEEPLPAGVIPAEYPVVAFEATPTGLGYWIVTADGELFAFGDAKYFGRVDVRNK